MIGDKIGMIEELYTEFDVVSTGNYRRYSSYRKLRIQFDNRTLNWQAYKEVEKNGSLFDYDLLYGERVMLK